MDITNVSVTPGHRAGKPFTEVLIRVHRPETGKDAILRVEVASDEDRIDLSACTTDGSALPIHTKEQEHTVFAGFARILGDDVK